MATTEEYRRRIRSFAEQMCSELGDFSVPEDESWLLAALTHIYHIRSAPLNF